MRTEDLVELFFPEGLLREFDVVRVETTQDEITVYLDEKANHQELTAEQRRKGFYSKGFTEATEFLDFPIRERLCRLMVRRRKWKVNGEKKLLMRPIELNAPKTKYTKGFAAFLKETSGD